MLDTVIIVVTDGLPDVDETEDDVCCSVSMTDNLNVCGQSLCFRQGDETIVFIEDDDIDHEGNMTVADSLDPVGEHSPSQGCRHFGGILQKT